MLQLLIITSANHALSPIEQEKQADREALTMLRDVRGGIYYFETELMVNRRLHALGESDFDDKGNRLHYTTHPALTDRVDYLRRWQKTAFSSLKVVRSNNHLQIASATGSGYLK
jgi:hypothetical protein